MSVRVLSAVLCVAAASLGLTSPARAASQPTAEDAPVPPPVVVWISVDGFRWDYLDRAATPVLDRLRREGAYTHAFVPVFPSLTFPTHVSQVTGVTPDRHGIVGNAFFDRGTGRVLSYPAPAHFLRTEPIWITAERQGVRTAVFDWPVSHSQQSSPEGEPDAATEGRPRVTASYFGAGYNPRLPDDVRLGQSLDAWETDKGETPLRLLMSYAVATDSPGHRFGPDAPEMEGVIAEADALVGRFVERLMELRRAKMHPRQELYLFITTDHGMSRVHSIVNPNTLLGVEDRRDIRVVNSGNVANVYLDQIEPQSARDAAVDAMLAAAARHPFARAYRAEDLPERLAYNHPGRTGDVVAILDRGYTFSSRVDGLLREATLEEGPLGMHGYDPQSNPDMYGFAVIWRYPTLLGGIDLGRLEAIRMHATVCEVLGIEPAEGAVGEAVTLPREPATVR